MTDWYSVAVEARSPRGAGLIGDDALDRFLDLLQPLHGVVGAAEGRWEARISLHAANAVSASTAAAKRVRIAAKGAGLPAWSFVRVEATRQDVLDEELARPVVPELAAAPEVARMLGVSPQRVHQLAVTHSRFPEPVPYLKTPKVWVKAAIEKFDQEWDRKPGRPRIAREAS